MATGKIYFVQAENGLVKIGFTSNLRSRLGNLNAMSPVPVRLLGALNGTHSDEGALHAHFSEHRQHGEWFDPAPEILEFAQRETMPPLSQLAQPPKVPGTDEQRSRIKLYVQAGGSIEQIAQSLGWSHKWVCGEIARMEKLGMLQSRT